MAPPAKARGGARPIAPGSAEANQGRPTTAAPERPPRGRSGGGSLPKPPQGHSGYERKIKRKLPRRDGAPPRYTNQNAKQQMLEAAIEAARDRGYEAMRISEVTDPIGVTRQAFYAHFRDKRHCMCEAIDPRLGAIERMTASLGESDPDSAAKLAHALDDLISEKFGSQEGTRGRLVSAMIELLRKEGSFHKVRIGALVKAAHVPPGDFYRQFSGKGECFAVAYEQLLAQLIVEVRECPAEHTRHDVPALLRSLAEALNSDPGRRRILIVEMAHLPDSAPEDAEGAWKGALADSISSLIGSSEPVAESDPRARWFVAAVVEVIRSSVLSGDEGALPEQLASLRIAASLRTWNPSLAA